MKLKKKKRPAAPKEGASSRSRCRGYCTTPVRAPCVTITSSFYTRPMCDHHIIILYLCVTITSPYYTYAEKERGIALHLFAPHVYTSGSRCVTSRGALCVCVCVCLIPAALAALPRVAPSLSLSVCLYDQSCCACCGVFLICYDHDDNCMNVFCLCVHLCECVLCCCVHVIVF